LTPGTRGHIDERLGATEVGLRALALDRRHADAVQLLQLPRQRRFAAQRRFVLHTVLPMSSSDICIAQQQ